LEQSAVHLAALIEPVAAGRTDMAIAVFAAPSQNGGFGIAKRVAQAGIYRLTGRRLAAPLSGQRAIRRELLQSIGRLPQGFGIEVGLTIDAARMGWCIAEVPLPLKHRELGKTMRGF